MNEQRVRILISYDREVELVDSFGIIVPTTHLSLDIDRETGNVSVTATFENVEIKCRNPE